MKGASQLPFAPVATLWQKVGAESSVPAAAVATDDLVEVAGRVVVVLDETVVSIHVNTIFMGQINKKKF